MLFNNKEINISELTMEEADDITSLMNIGEEADDGDTITYETAETIDIEGMVFRPMYSFEVTDGEKILTSIELIAEHSGDDTLELIHAWKDRIKEKYDCTVWNEEYEQPDFNAELGFEDDEDHWTLRIYTNAFNFDYDIRIDVE